MPPATASPLAVQDVARPFASAPGEDGATRPALPVRWARGARRALEELGWLLLFVFLFPFAILLVGSLIGLVLQAGISILDRF